MKTLTILAISLLLAGCNNTEITRSAGSAVDHIAHATAGYGGWSFAELKNRMRSRQEQWSHHNQFRWPERPGWKGERCALGAKADPCRPHSSRRPAVMLSAEMNAPALGQLDRKAYEKVARAYGISERASTLLLEALNRAAVGDFGGLKEIGLNSERIASAHLNGGQLSLNAMEAVSQALDLDPAKVESIIQSIFGQR
jgi:hypothetical protein